jgi:hypothetical protein
MERSVEIMSYHKVRSEYLSPVERTDAVRGLLESLGLDDGVLSHRDLERVTWAIASQRHLFEDLVLDDEQARRETLLFRSRDVEVKLLTWAPGSSSDWHVHAGSSGAFAVTSGVLLERHRGDDRVGVVSGHFDVGRFGAFGPDYVHDITNGTGSPAVSIHVHSPPLR